MSAEQETMLCPVCKNGSLELHKVSVYGVKRRIYSCCALDCWFRCNEEHLPKLATLERQKDSLKRAIMDCIEYTNGREDEWGDRAIESFNILHEALAQPEEKGTQP